VGKVQGTEVKDRGRVPAEPVANFMAATETASGTLRGLSGMAHAHVPMSGRCLSVYSCADMYIADVYSDHQFSLVCQIVAAPNAGYFPVDASTAAGHIRGCSSFRLVN
jgi:hypothetical protein